MRVSHAEFAFAVTRAAVGSGWPWGMAEELARAAAHAPCGGDEAIEAAIWACGPGKAAAMAAPAAMDAMIAGRAMEPLRHHGQPALFHGFVAAASATYAEALEANDDGEALTIRRGGEAPCKPSARDVTPGLWAKLNALAAKTYVPSNEESRLAGAGAGLTDND